MFSYLMSIVVLGVFFVVAVAIYYFWDEGKRKQKLEAAFIGRVPDDERTYFETYFEARGVPADVVRKIKHVLEDELEADLSCLRAEDDFAHNLNFFFEHDSLADVKIVTRLEEKFSVKITDAEAGAVSSIEGIVDLVWSKIRPREA